MPTPIIRTTEEEATHREMERVSLDWCMIYNPTSDDFYIEWAAKDGRPWKYLVPNKDKDIGWGEGKLEVQRYLAVWYCNHMKDKIVNDKGQKEYDKLVAERREKGLYELTKFEEQKAIWEKLPKTNSEKELKNLYPLLFLGVTREFGMDYEPNSPYTVEQTTVQEKVFDTIKNKKYVPEGKTATTPKNQPKSKVSAPLPSIEELESLIKNE